MYIPCWRKIRICQWDDADFDEHDLAKKGEVPRVASKNSTATADSLQMTPTTCRPCLTSAGGGAMRNSFSATYRVSAMRWGTC